METIKKQQPGRITANGNMPKPDDLTDEQRYREDGYWMAIVKNEEGLAEIRKSFPGWMPEFEY